MILIFFPKFNIFVEFQNLNLVMIIITILLQKFW